MARTGLSSCLLFAPRSRGGLRERPRQIFLNRRKARQQVAEQWLPSDRAPARWWLVGIILRLEYLCERRVQRREIIPNGQHDAFIKNVVIRVRKQIAEAGDHLCRDAMRGKNVGWDIPYRSVNRNEGALDSIARLAVRLDRGKIEPGSPLWVR